MKHLIAPSVLAADFGNLQRDIEMLNQSAAEWIHVDVMDGLFVPNISFGFPVMETLRKHAGKPLDVHLMITDPDRYVERFAQAGASVITVHYEACTHLHRTIEAIQGAGCRAGVALNPHTPVQLLQDILPMLDLVLIMSVNPGFGGQKFIPNTYKKIAELCRLPGAKDSLIIEVDGGVDSGNIAALRKAGAHAFVAGSAVFSAPDPAAMIAELNQIASIAFDVQV
ncbi:ribulose-phosphate 3-epimerase [Pedobacter yulinensis]|uniref:Ribulose-phosphate 3-epimerase n=1 Tax=Pedobacter yulinensis TaxID=2126353 RepID=A0A2T3HJC7_9SPHI|nr:ribulose-phosphate 3-epimerase [Pedobacter yulinensis]PST82481.1 ribulose-phosphate 3-epimerase [Pedobacter yulinensis]